MPFILLATGRYKKATFTNFTGGELPSTPRQYTKLHKHKLSDGELPFTPPRNKRGQSTTRKLPFILIGRE